MTSRIKYIIFGVLTLLTLFLTIIIGRYQTTGPELLLNAQFIEGLTHWNQSGNKNSIIISQGNEVQFNSSDKFSIVTLSQNISDPGRFKFLRMSGEIKTEDVIQKESEGDNARLSLIFLDNEGRRLPQETRVQALLGSHPWKHYSRVFPVPPEAENAVVSAQLLHATGTMWIRNLSLQEVYEKPVYPYGKVICIILWSLFLLWLIVPMITEATGNVVRVVISIAIASIMLGTLMSETGLNPVEGKLIENRKEIATDNRDDNDPYEKKLKEERGHPAIYLWKYREEGGHFILFAFLGVSLMTGFPMGNRKFLFADIAMLAASTELLQFFVEGRGPSLGDWFVDLSGALCGMYLVCLVRSRKQSI